MNTTPIITDPRYWDCECGRNYIKLKSIKYCDKCGALADEMPDSRVDEVKQFLSDTFNSNYRQPVDRVYGTVLTLLEKAVDTMAAEGPQHPREVIPQGKRGNKTLYGCLPACRPPDWYMFESFEYNACEEDLMENYVEPLWKWDNYKAQFWSVYGRMKKDYGYELIAITDVHTEKLAASLCELFAANLSKGKHTDPLDTIEESDTELPRGCA